MCVVYSCLFICIFRSVDYPEEEDKDKANKAVPEGEDGNKSAAGSGGDTVNSQPKKQTKKSQ